MNAVDMTKPGKIIYLSGAPRVSTRPDAAASGPRAHILGVMQGFKLLGWEVDAFIAGDHVPERWVVGESSELTMRASPVNRLGADAVRLGLGMYNRWRVARRFSSADFSYERYGVFQALGSGLQRKGIPWIVECNGLMYVEAVEDRSVVVLQDLARRWERWVYQRCDVLVSISHTLTDLVVAKLGIPREKIITMPVAADVERFEPAGVTSRRFDTAPTIGFVGTFIAWQALDMLIEAVAELRAEGMVYHLVLVGDGAFRAAWQAQVERLGLGEQVRFTGRVPYTEVPAYIKGFDLAYSGQIALQTGSMYGSPSKIYEYMAMEKAVIASDSFEDAGVLIREGETGFLFKSEDKESLKHTLRKAYHCQPQWQTMGQRARQEVLTRHSWTTRVSRMIIDSQTVLERKEKR